MLEMTTARSAIKILRRFIIFAPYHHFAFLISNFSFNQGFHPPSKDDPPLGLTLTPYLPNSFCSFASFSKISLAAFSR